MRKSARRRAIPPRSLLPQPKIGSSGRVPHGARRSLARAFICCRTGVAPRAARRRRSLPPRHPGLHILLCLLEQCPHVVVRVLLLLRAAPGRSPDKVDRTLVLLSSRRDSTTTNNMSGTLQQKMHFANVKSRGDPPQARAWFFAEGSAPLSRSNSANSTEPSVLPGRFTAWKRMRGRHAHQPLLQRCDTSQPGIDRRAVQRSRQILAHREVKWRCELLPREFHVRPSLDEFAPSLPLARSGTVVERGVAGLQNREGESAAGVTKSVTSDSIMTREGEQGIRSVSAHPVQHVHIRPERQQHLHGRDAALRGGLVEIAHPVLHFHTRGDSKSGFHFQPKSRR